MNLDNLRDAVQNISLYDVKAAVRKAQNGELFHPPLALSGCFEPPGAIPLRFDCLFMFSTVVMNYTEMEAKV